MSFRGILGGSRADFEALNDFLTEHKIHPDLLIDRTFSFEETEAALEYLSSRKRTGKVVVKF